VLQSLNGSTGNVLETDPARGHPADVKLLRKGARVRSSVLPRSLSSASRAVTMAMPWWVPMGRDLSGLLWARHAMRN
jgi:hypothetical protein